MKKQTIIFFILGLLISCNNIDFKPKYIDFENAWESENLIGKVKTLEQSKAKVNNFKTGEKDRPLIEFKKEFTENGNISYEEHYGDSGQINSFIKNEYNKNGQRIKSTSKYLLIPLNSTVTSEFNTPGKLISASIYQNDTLDEKAILEYDSSGKLKTKTSIRNTDTTTGKYEYKYNENGKILWKKQTETINNNRHESFIWFKYDQNGNLIELLNKAVSDIGLLGELYKTIPDYEIKTTYEYDRKNRIKKTIKYKSGKIEEEKEFDKFYNQTLVKFYVSGALNREMKYEYEFDNKGNWIERNVFLKQDFGQDKNWILIFVETRKIVYYK